MPSLNSLLTMVCKGTSWKTSDVVVGGILGFEDQHELIADKGRPFTAYDSTDSRVPSQLDGELPSFRYREPPRHCEYVFDSEEPLEDVGTLIVFRDTLPPCISFAPGATMVGDEASLLNRLRGHEFFPRARWRDLAAMEIIT